MADLMMPATTPGHIDPPDHVPEVVSKRDFVKLLTASAAAVGVGAIAWPLIDSMNPSADVLALSSTEVDLKPIVAGQAITVVWRGKPVFVRSRTDAEIKAAQDTTALDADLIAEMAMRNNDVTIAERLAALRARWDGGEQTPQVRGVLADWQAIAAARARLRTSWLASTEHRVFSVGISKNSLTPAT